MATDAWVKRREGCHATFNGGHHTSETIDAFHHGMDTVFNMLEAEFPAPATCKASSELLTALIDLLRETDGGMQPCATHYTVKAALAIANALTP